MNHPDAVNSVYSIIAREITENRFDKTLMTRAIAETHGDQNAAHSLYIRLRAEQLHSELEASLLARATPAPKTASALCPPNRPLHKYNLAEDGLFFSTPYYTVVVKERSLSISSSKLAIEIDASTEDYGIRLTKRLVNHSTLSIYGVNKPFCLTLQISTSQYKELTAWKNTNRIP